MKELKSELKTITSKKLVGKHISMCMAQNKTHELWKSFMPRRKEIPNTIGTELYSVQIFGPDINFKDFTPNTVFDKWAAVEVSDFESIPEGMQMLTIEGGLYAVFNYKGRASEAGPAFQYIFNTWLPGSRYELDNRAHFEVMGGIFIRPGLIADGYCLNRFRLIGIAAGESG